MEKALKSEPWGAEKEQLRNSGAGLPTSKNNTERDGEVVSMGIQPYAIH